MPMLAGREGALDDMISIFSLSAMETLFRGEGIVPVSPASRGEEIVAQLSDLNLSVAKPANCLSVSLSINHVRDCRKTIGSIS
jgi:hypothetical protein